MKCSGGTAVLLHGGILCRIGTESQLTSYINLYKFGQKNKSLLFENAVRLLLQLGFIVMCEIGLIFAERSCLCHGKWSYPHTAASHSHVWQNAERQMLLQHQQGSEEEVNGFIGTSMEEERGITFLSMMQGKKITYHNEYLMQK